MVKYVVLYEGRPEDPEAFDRHYRDHHLPIIARWPGIRRIQVNRGVPLEDPGQGRKVGDFYQVCEFLFDSMADLEKALASPERREAGEDRARFPRFEGRVRHQAVEIEDFDLAMPQMM